MEEHRAYQAKQDYLAAQRDRTRLLKHCLHDLEQKKNPGKVICPKSFFVESTQQISALLNAPAEETVEFSDSLLLDLVESWRQSTDTELRNMVIAGSTSSGKSDAMDPLLLATYPEILNHSCATYASYSEECLRNADGQRVFFSDEAYSRAKSILEASGLDPETTTREDVQWPKFYIECHDCPTKKLTEGDRLLMAWLSAVSCTSRDILAIFLIVVFTVVPSIRRG